MNKWIYQLKNSVLERPPYSFNELKKPVKLNQNESPYDIPENLKHEIFNRALQLNWNRYPDIIGAPVRDALSRHLGLPPERIAVGVGSDELLLAISALILDKAKKVLIIEPTFQMYSQCADIFEAEVIRLTMDDGFRFPVENMLTVLRECAIHLVFVASPNSPTGGIIEPEAVEECARHTDGFVVVDEAYYEFCGQTALEAQKKQNNIIITRTFSKAMSMAGLRLGYMIADPEIISYIYKVKNPFSVNLFTEAAALTILDNRRVFEENVKKILDDKVVLQEQLSKIKGIRIVPSHANFFMIDAGEIGSSLVRQLAAHGIAVRDISSYPLCENHIRVNVGTVEENMRFIEAMRSIYSGVNSG
ncbi:histidinol-phosphate transaminase [candidate division KSB1 bacterium]